MRWALLLALVTAGCGYRHHLRPVDGDAGDSAVTTRDAGDPDDANGLDASDSGERDASDLPDATHDANTSDTGTDTGIDAGSTRGCTVPDDYPTLQAALDEPTCDPIVVRGTLGLPATADVKRDVTITSVDSASVAQLQGLGMGSVIQIAPNVRVTLERLGISGGLAEQGAGIRSEGHLTLRGTWVVDNRGYGAEVFGAGLYQRGGSLRLEADTVFASNHADGSEVVGYGGAIFLQDTTAVSEGALTIRDNLVTGAPYAFGGAIALIDSSFESTAGLVVSGNEAASTSVNGLAGGGGFYLFRSHLTLGDAEITDNHARAESTGAGAAVATGGGIGCEDSRVSLIGGVASMNEVLSMGGASDSASSASGGFLTGTHCETTITGMSITDNHVECTAAPSRIAITGGGALHCTGFAQWNISESRLSRNQARSTIRGAAPAPGLTSRARGGAISNFGCEMMIVDSLLDANQAVVEAHDQRGDGDLACGGAIAVTETDQLPSLWIEGSSLIDNTAAFRSEQAAEAAGGALYLQNSNVRLTTVAINTTFSGNATNASGSNDGSLAGGVTARGGAMAIDTLGRWVTIQLRNVTIASNTVNAPYAFGGAIDYAPGPDSEIPQLSHTILWNNSVRNGALLEDCSGQWLASAGYNFASPMCFSQSAPTDRADDPGIQSRTECGDLCSIHPLIESSAARNAGDPNGCLDLDDLRLSVDQRGQPRSDRCDIGAFEL